MINFNPYSPGLLHWHCTGASEVYLNNMHNNDKCIYIHLQILESKYHFDGLVQERSNSSAWAMELCLSYTNTPI